MPIIKTEQQMISLGKKLGKTLLPPTTIELIGDVGAGKTTLVKGIALALGIPDPITSPSFTLSKTYTGKTAHLTHYDFYRIPNAGIMQEDLAESIADPSTITIVEWAQTVASVLPPNHITVTITYRNDNSRQVEVER